MRASWVMPSTAMATAVAIPTTSTRAGAVGTSGSPRHLRGSAKDGELSATGRGIGLAA